MNDDLFTTRQITGYQTWPDGRQGCLFFIPNFYYWGHSCDLIALIDSPVRKEDTIGACDTLHKAELDAINKQNVIALGYFAALTYRFFELDQPDAIDLVDLFDDFEEWDHYYARKRNGASPVFRYDADLFYFETEGIRESNMPYLNQLFKPFFSNDCKNLDELFRFAYKIPLLNWLEKDETQLSELAFEVQFDDPEDPEDGYIAEYSLDDHILCVPGAKQWTISGFQAFFMNYAMANFTCTDFRKKAYNGDFIPAVNTLYERIWYGELKYDDVEIDHRKLNLKQIYDAYIQDAQSKIFDTLKARFVSFSIMDEKSQQIKVLKLLFQREWNKAQKSNPFILRLKKIHRQLLHIGLQYFFLYILGLIKDDQEAYTACYNLMNNVEQPEPALPQSEETKPALEPIPNLDKPKLRKDGKPSYEEIYNYIKTRVKYDPEFKNICQYKSITYICQILSTTFGYDVVDNSLRRYITRNKLSDLKALK